MRSDDVRPSRVAGSRARGQGGLVQYGGIQALLSWHVLAGAVSTPLPVLADRLGLRLERSFNERHGCQFAYLEIGDDAYTLVSWDPSTDVEVWASPQDDRRGTESLPAGSSEFGRFLRFAELSPGDVIIPRAMGQVRLQP